MKIHRFITSYTKTNGHIVILDLPTIHQIYTVLKLHNNEKIILSNGEGEDLYITITHTSKKSIEGTLEKTTHIKDSEPKLNIYLSLIKNEHFELAIEKSVEVGLSSITPIISDRTIKKGFKKERILNIIKEATEQSGQSFLPKLTTEKKFKDAINKSIEENDVTIIFDEHAEVNDKISDAKNIGYFIGPEGGFTEEEILYARHKGVSFISLGSTTLRAETAAPIATYILKNTLY